mmetsp:Transcript_150633/g.276711  ORF Transcript_150633/g.276711 Transcript_150633/m.276711 type:complete len:290 (+) Transcript_150633:96-965(+)
MPVMKLIHLAVLCQAASLCLAVEEACHDSVTEEAGRAMMQLSGGPTKKSGPKDAPAQKSKPTTKTTKLSKKSNSTAKTPDASNVALSNSGYKTIAAMCCNYEMEEYIRRIVMSENLKVCSEGGLEGTVPYYTCENKQNYSMLLAEVKASGTGTCPWTAPKGGSCKKISKACSATSDPMSHRRRNCGRNDNSQDLDLEMQNAATNEFVESKCGTHQQYSDVSADGGIIKSCSITGDITSNSTALNLCLNECCVVDDCIGIVVKKSGTSLQKNFDEAESDSGAIAYLHRQR